MKIVSHLFQAALMLTALNTFGQSITSALSHDDTYDIRPGSHAVEITTESTFYNRSGKEKHKDITVLNDRDMLVSENRFDENGNIRALLYFEYDAGGTQRLKRSFKQKINLVGVSSETATYTYDANGYMVAITDRNSSNMIFRQTFITNNEAGLPIALTTTDGNGNPYGTETAVYDIPNNTVAISYYNANDEKVNEVQHTINYAVQDEGDVYNEFGDPVRAGDFEFEYRYDSHNNWIKQVRYKIFGSRKEKNAEFSRKIKYKK